MSFSEWFFGGIENPRVENQWGPLHIATLVVCVALILTFYYIAKKTSNPDKVKTHIVRTLAGLIAFFEIASRFMYLMKLYYFHQPEMNGIDLLWIVLPKPWCAISCWLLIACVFVRKTFFYNFGGTEIEILPADTDWAAPELLRKIATKYFCTEDVFFRKVQMYVVNISSLWFIIRHGGKKLVFTGDTPKRTRWMTDEGFDRFKCLRQCLKNMARYPGADVCGKCIVELPCSYGIPKTTTKE